MQSDHNLILSHSNKYIQKILRAKNKYMLRVSKNLIGLFSIAFSAIKRYLVFLRSFITVNVYQASKRKPIDVINFFACQCTPLSNSSVSPDISFQTNTHLVLFSSTEKYILAVIKSLDLSKSHGWNHTS